MNTKLRLKRLGINTYHEPVIYMREDCPICRAEGFEAPARVVVSSCHGALIATLNTVESHLLALDEVSLSNFAWDKLSAKEGDEVTISHPKTVNSLGFIRSKIHGNILKTEEMNRIIEDIVDGQLSDIQLAMFLSAIGGDRLSQSEIFDLTNAMVKTGATLQWPAPMVVDKHCVGGLPGNRTTPIIVSIVAAYGMMIPKTSSRAITSPAGTADTMEVLTPVNLDLAKMRKVVERENGCMVWGGSMSLSPSDDILIRIERVMDLDSEGQLIASILSKKIAAGATHVLIDMPIGETAKIRSFHKAEKIKKYLESIAHAFSMKLRVVFTDGTQPVGRGVGPALEAQDVLSVLLCDEHAPKDLRERALHLAGHVLEFSPSVAQGTGHELAASLLDSGKAFKKFEAICYAQGGFFEIPTAPYTKTIVAKKRGCVTRIDNRLLSRLAKLAGAPRAPSAGVKLHAMLNSVVEKGQPLFTVHAESQGELRYALQFHQQGYAIFHIEECS